MTDPLKLITPYFTTAKTLTDGETIADVQTLEAITADFVPTMSTLHIFSMNDEQTKIVSGKGFTGQRQLSRAYLRFLTRHPQYVERSGVDPALFEQVISLDEGYDLLGLTLEQTQQLIKDGSLQLDAALSQKVLLALKQYHSVIDDKAGDPGRSLQWQVAFNAVEKSADEVAQNTKAKGQKQKLRVRNYAQARAGTVQRTVEATGSAHFLNDATGSGQGPLLTTIRQQPALGAHQPASGTQPAGRAKGRRGTVTKQG